MDEHGNNIDVVTRIREDEEGLQDGVNAESDAHEEKHWDEVPTTTSIYTSPTGFENLRSNLFQQTLGWEG